MIKNKITNFSLLFIILYVICSCHVAPKYVDQYRIEVEGKYGFIDSLGHELIPAKYLYAEYFNKEGISLVILDTIIRTEIDSIKIGDIRNQLKTRRMLIKYAYINTFGNYLFPTPQIGSIIIDDNYQLKEQLSTFAQNHSFKNGLAVIEDTITHLKGYINQERDTIIPCKYSDAKCFSEGLAVVQLSYDESLPVKNWGKYGFIDTNGNPIGDFIYLSLTNCVRNRAVGTIVSTHLEKGGHTITGELAKDEDGNVFVDESKRTEVDYGEEGNITTSYGHYLLDEKVHIICQLNASYQYHTFSKDEIAVCSPNVIATFLGIGYKFLDSNGNFLEFKVDPNKEIPEEYSENNHFAGFVTDELVFKDVTFFSNGYAGVCLQENRWFFIDKNGFAWCTDKQNPYEEVLPFRYGKAPVKQDGKWGLIDGNFDYVLPCQYDSCGVVGKNLFEVFQFSNNVDTHSFVDFNGNIKWQNTYVKSAFDGKLSNSEQYGNWHPVDYNYRNNQNNSYIIIILGIVPIFFMIFLLKKIITFHYRGNEKAREKNDSVANNKLVPFEKYIDQQKKIEREFQEQIKAIEIFSQRSDIAIIPNIDRTTKQSQDYEVAKTSKKIVKKKQASIEEKAISTSKVKTDLQKFQYVDFDLSHYANNSSYPMVSVPKTDTIVFPYRTNKTKRRGYCEVSFESALRNKLPKVITVMGDCSLALADHERAYEPDIAIVYKNLRIDIEIDEPYAGITRIPTHYLKCGDELRDVYLANAGWVTVRFAEIQVHKEQEACIGYICKIIHTIYPEIPEKIKTSKLTSIKKWSKIECQIWEKEKYRESYLGIKTFGFDDVCEDSIVTQTVEEKNASLQLDEITLLTKTNEKNIDKSKLSFIQDKRITFFSSEHIYMLDGVKQLKPVSHVIEYFFKAFDTLYWSEIKSKRNGISQMKQIELWDCKAAESRETGTFLHKQIEKSFAGNRLKMNYTFTYNGNEVKESKTIDISTEFKFFQNFIKDYKPKPFRTEWQVFDPNLEIAGTIDLICRNGEKFDLFDWKRSDKVNPRETAWGNGINGLESVPDTRYRKYCIQLNLYKYILETNYGIQINHMNLVVLHPNNNNYEIIRVPEMKNEIGIIVSHLDGAD